MTLLWILLWPAWANDEIVRALVLTAHGEHIAFDQTRLEVPLAAKIRLTFDNQAPADSGILHNIVLLKPGTLDAVLGRARAAGYDLEKLRDDPDILGFSPTVPPGGRGELVFAPTGPGTYPYVCLMPGHGDLLGMRGELTVTPPTTP